MCVDSERFGENVLKGGQVGEHQCVGGRVILYKNVVQSKL